MKKKFLAIYFLLIGFFSTYAKDVFKKLECSKILFPAEISVSDEFGYSDIYFYGFSDDGKKIGYFLLEGYDGCSGKEIKYRIQNLVTDSIEWEFVDQNFFEKEFSYENSYIIQESLKSNLKIVMEKFNDSKIKISDANIKTFPAIIRNNNYNCSLTINTCIKNELNTISYECYVSRNETKKKVAVFENRIANFSYVIGYILNDNQDRMAVIIAEEEIGWEGIKEVHYYFVGCKLD